MNGYEDQVPAFLTFRVTPQEGTIAAFAEQEAWQARKRYPEILGVGVPEFYHARECETGGWELPEFSSDTPRGARDGLGSRFRRRAQDASGAGQDKEHRKWLAAAARMDREVVDEVRVLGERFRIVRASRFIRMGPSGPEPPRPSDPDPGEAGESHRVPSRTNGFVIDPYTGTGLADGILKLDLVRLSAPRPARPARSRTTPGGPPSGTPAGCCCPPSSWSPSGRTGSGGPATPRPRTRRPRAPGTPWPPGCG
ncbi:hypothetical protein GCM10010278_21660 [Streptomyces melanogenes]|nr:hypothetical protein GCM10010278_21660 [Streptomyces melanogenes]